MANNNLIVKITHGTEIRRFTSNNALENTTYHALSKRVAELFDLPKSFKLTYIDDEGDRITVTTDAELHEAVGLALTTSPAVLRLSVLLALESKSTGSATTDALMADAATDPPTKSTADAGTHAKPCMADAGTHGGRPATSECGTSCGTHAPAPESTAKPEYTALLNTIAAQLPALASHLPDAVRALLPNAELDLAATLAANAAANAGCAAADAAKRASSAHASAPMPNGFVPMVGAHAGVRCDRSGVSPIVGNRYNLVGHNYDLCEAEFAKLPEKEQALYLRIPPPPAAPVHIDEPHPAGLHPGLHPGVECDRSGQCPIIGIRYHLQGHDYDLCQAEFDKLPATEKLLYTPIPPRASAADPHADPPRPWGCARPAGVGFGFGRGPHAAAHAWCGARHAHHHGSYAYSHAGPHGAGGGAGGMGGGMGSGKLAARFVRDVSIFDGTQMAPSTNFTKIWRLKNSGDVPWPPGTRMLFVGGDQMTPTTEMSLPLSRAGPVMPGEEVDVAVEMVAPSELGRYLGYWRLMGPRGRKFGQRVWCHVQVVDPAAVETPASASELDRTAAEIEKKKSELIASTALLEEADEHVDDEPHDKPDAHEATVNAADDTTLSATTAALSAATISAGATTAAGATHQLAPDQPPADPPDAALPLSELSQLAGELSSAARSSAAPAAGGALVPDAAADNLSDVSDSVLVTAGMAMDAGMALDAGDAASRSAASLSAASAAFTAASAAAMDINEIDTTTSEGVALALNAMGFADAAMIEVVINKHGADLAACARDLSAASEWAPLLADLEEMGFTSRELNKALMLQHDGNLKRTVKALVEDA